MFGAFVVTLCAVMAVAVRVGARTVRDHCTFASTTMPTPDGWQRIDGRTFRHGSVQGTIERVAVPRGLDDAALEAFYARILAREQRDVGSDVSAISTMATPLHGNIGVYQTFTYDRSSGTQFTRVDHIMHPGPGGCGWHFRAEFASKNAAPGEEYAAHFPDNFSFVV